MPILRGCIFFLLCVTCLSQAPALAKEAQQSGLLVAQLQEPSVLSSRREIFRLVNLAKETGTGIIFIQVFRAHRAWFASKIADSSPYAFCFRSLSEDPLRLLIKQAHTKGIKVCAWMNLLSLSTNKDAFILKKYGSGILTTNRKKKDTIKDYQIDHQYFLEPGDLRVRKELASLVEEVLLDYPDLDGILFDYIRYPDVNPDYGYTEVNIERFKKATGLKRIEKDNLAWQDWKREQVNELLRQLVARARALRPHIQIGATGCAPYVRAYQEAFQNWPEWVNEGMVDFVFLMSYPANEQDFRKDIQEAKKRVGDFKKVYIGVPAYKLMYSPQIFKREFQIVQSSGSGGYGIFHYDSLLESRDLINILTGNKQL
jgi:uncharacterized lipoprotein YddW (UPF0748 family)